MSIITEQHIVSIYNNTLSELSNILPVSKWKVTPRSLVVEDLGNNLGLACPNGEIKITSKYIGTTAKESLKETIAHEFSHFIVGLNHGHDKLFKRILDSTIYRLGIDLKLVEEQKFLVAKNRNFKWSIFATLEDGTRLFFGFAKVKNKKYSQYHLNPNLLWAEQDGNYGKKIHSFEYIEN
ncbi:hypothetical protein [Photobacterium damselae]|uniref:hypothetical protein n=1 Tax=Photobacterium damselae TaxID=38293 RepID=UPI001F37396E|nr:hypothetical protein [Photobacterium damselae]UKA04856.1 hypothetical protein IHC89_21675 [Photobacterium damselae subsp. damselae]